MLKSGPKPEDNEEEYDYFQCDDCGDTSVDHPIACDYCGSFAINGMYVGYLVGGRE